MINKSALAYFRKNSGFTFIELLVVMSIAGVLFGIGFANYSKFNKNQTVKHAALEFKNNLRLAQEKAISAQEPDECKPDGLGEDDAFSGYNVWVRNNAMQNEYTIVARCVDETTGNDIAIESTRDDYTLSENVEFDVVNTGVRFYPLSQGANNNRTFTLRHKKDAGIFAQINVTTAGEISGP